MATGGQNISSEEAFDYNCTPCTHQERFIEAERFCVECGEYFCSTCLSCHERFSATKGHTLVKCEEVSTEHVVTRLSKCERHTDKEEDMVCCDHDVVCCRACITTDHSSCERIDYLPHLAQLFRKDGKRTNLENDLKNKKQEINSAYNECTARALRFKTRKATHLKRLESLKKSITECVNIAITKAETHINNHFGPDICSMQEDILMYNKSMSKLSCLSEDLSKESDEIDECKKILECRRMLREIQIEPCAFDDEKDIDLNLQNEIVDAIDNCMKEKRLIFYFENVHFQNDAIITDLCVNEGDHSSFLLIANYHNNTITSVGRDWIKNESVDVKGKVWGICKTNSYANACTLTNLSKVQSISTDKGHILKSSFPTNLTCRGIAYQNEKIYVTGGGLTGEEEGRVNVFDLKGDLICKYKGDIEGNYFRIPRSIDVNTNGIYVTDQHNGIVCLDLEGKRKWVCSNTKCKFPWGICFTQKDNLLVSGRDSNNIVIIGKDGEFLGELLNENDGLTKPMALGIDKERNFIIVSEYGKPTLKVFYLGDCEI